jgi:PleD family two-component response regulator
LIQLNLHAATCGATQLASAGSACTASAFEDVIRVSTVLVVDRSARNRRSVADALSRSGHLTVEAAPGSEVASILAVASPDVIVTNINARGSDAGMPHVSSFSTKLRPKVLYTDRYLTSIDLGLSGGCAPFAELIEAVDDYLTVCI